MKKIIAFIGAVLVTLGLASVAHANPSYFVPTVQSAPATTTVNYMTSGTATTTLPVYDSFNSGSTYKTDFAVLLEQFIGSSTSSVLNTNIEYSQDGVDWYQDGIIQNATTTQPVNITAANYYTFAWTGKQAGGLAGSNATSTRAIMIPTPLRFTRVVLSMPVGSAAGATWAQIVPIKQKPE